MLTELINMRSELYQTNAISNVGYLADCVFTVYQKGHEPGQLVEFISNTDAGYDFVVSNDCSGKKDEQIWEMVRDQFDDNELLELLQSWVPI